MGADAWVVRGCATRGSASCLETGSDDIGDGDWEFVSLPELPAAPVVSKRSSGPRSLLQRAAPQLRSTTTAKASALPLRGNPGLERKAAGGARNSSLAVVEVADGDWTLLELPVRSGASVCGSARRAPIRGGIRCFASAGGRPAGSVGGQARSAVALPSASALECGMSVKKNESPLCRVQAQPPLTLALLPPAILPPVTLQKALPAPSPLCETVENDSWGGGFVLVPAPARVPQRMIGAGFVLVPSTAATSGRSFAERRPRAATAVLWTWLALLVLGELAVTLWWLASLGVMDLLVLLMPIAVGLSLLLLAMSREQVVAVAVSVLLAALPALPAYSAVLLVSPPPSIGCSLDVLHWLTLTALGILHLLAALPLALRLEHQRLLDALGTARCVARCACILAACLYACLAAGVLARFVHALLVGAARNEGASSGVEGTSVRRSRLALELCLNALGLFCADLRRRTCESLGDALLPRLIGVTRARKLTFRELATRHGFKVLRKVPSLRRCCPPPFTVACIVAAQRLAPLLLPALALLLRWGCLPVSGIALAALALALAAAAELRAVPSAPLRRLPLLVPMVAARPHMRAAVGYALEAAEAVEVARSSVSTSVRSLRRRLSWQPATPAVADVAR
eukprot:TRINITY_DN30928_c0_g1_i1.p1 TRINITY_DN30928_c0_g1~~TRINITY_DN30928_c0_g1_i1.p1  ORF type:complete len:630 (+),score=114.40 TRINITY_DN30928_c0_g1_i1:97-1986(+)